MRARAGGRPPPRQQRRCSQRRNPRVAVCVACHTFDGTRGLAANPILQGQHPEYLLKQLQEFKSGVRDNAIMKGFASTLSDQDMLDLATFFSSQTTKLRDLQGIH